MKSIDWNEMSELGLITRINKEILHPLGLAISKNPDTGISEKILIAPDGVFEYPSDFVFKNFSDEEIKAKINELI